MNADKPKRLMLIVNPVSGTASKEELVPRIEEYLLSLGFDYETRFTGKRGDATALATEAVERGMHAVVACGGDGTINEVARALSDTSVPMCIVPAGSGNGLARHIGLPSDALAALRVLAKDNVSKCDYADANGEKFFCTFGIGFDAEVTRNFHSHSRRGFATYIQSAFREFLRYKPRHYTITIDGHTFERKAYLVAVCNASQYGNNAYIAPSASITDGVLDVVIIRDAPPVQTLLAGVDLMVGTLPRNSQVEVIKARKVKIIQDSDQAPAHIDGEPVTMPQDIDVKIHPHSLLLYTDPDKKHFTAFLTPVEFMVRDLGITFSKIANFR